ncbi:MAG: hypothetical protein A2747_03845 [Candidatus Yonathbacteria bacterium RIFCSPHIGHO2_01_FULL_44_41]|uniref:Cohesin domain-containing protein n=1 Tax=Candidatus Yonathbacteria bacterium RIFCSPHIGHO2_02_FULL_44_14 TaxID=1802724 RepID=A0A1G2S7G8_9BACT|nr:MAG: hypothetical protein A2747_03845 [Candidatus Yonathbacteria bacterium RIFCSPHIGHO2_01_FULL_44_41]OHA81053.1 MAG: hypothetical protein A3D51_01735 [Candidatus Yonathbacteria bacterium RIFCSPHIGHO2_02_FULL_44_14]OHA81276.1 MAG: hypothetical protein A3B06_03445 [Candidatus Yonathbacteria bacterium RIFCSPLOWO2_01_FULL_43_20]
MARSIKISFIFGLVAFFANTADAASLFFTPGTGEYGIGKEIAVDLKIDSSDTGINAGQATIRYPKDILEVKSIDKTDSAFNFWLEEPAFSNADGAITFLGGTPYGISGASIQVLHIIFITKTAGTGTLSFADAAVTASDASGTNVLSKTEEAAFTVSLATLPPIITPPTQIKREPVAPSGLPIKPILNVPLYTDSAEWYNHSNIFNASWALPRDISDVVTALNKQPSYTPAESEGLFDNKMFQALSDGVWYLHVRFNNDIGWGTTSHYRIAVDTKPPLPFEVTSTESEVSDNPNPIFKFKASDALSGLREYRVRAGTENWIVIPAKDFKGLFALPIENPGKYHVTVQAVDNAGNSIESGIDHETLAIASPTFTFVTEKLFSEEAQGLSLKGTALPSTEILLALKSGSTVIASSTLPVNAQGNWEFTFSDPLRNGSYIASIQNRDARGARSLVVNSPTIQVTGKYTNIILVTLIALVGALALGTWYYKKRNKQISLRVGVAQSDASKVFKMIENDIEKLNSARSTPTTADDEFLAKKLSENVKKMGVYIKEEIDRADD